jgi:transcriptional regulator with XRE-family HTH domain
MENPLSFALKTTQTKPIDLASQLGLSRQYVSRAEMGCHLNLSVRVVKWIQLSVNQEFSGGLSYSAIGTWYRLFQTERRTQTRNRIGINNLRELLPPVASSIAAPDEYRARFKEWRTIYWPTRYAFAKDMCVHPGSVDSFESGKSRKIPHDLMAVLVWLERDELPKKGES